MKHFRECCYGKNIQREVKRNYRYRPNVPILSAYSCTSFYVKRVHSCSRWRYYSSDEHLFLRRSRSISRVLENVQDFQLSSPFIRFSAIQIRVIFSRFSELSVTENGSTPPDQSESRIQKRCGINRNKTFSERILKPRRIWQRYTAGVPARRHV